MINGCTQCLKFECSLLAILTDYMLATRLMLLLGVTPSGYQSGDSPTSLPLRMSSMPGTIGADEVLGVNVD